MIDKSDIPVIIVYACLELPLLLFMDYSLSYLTVAQITLYQVYLGGLTFLLYAMKENIKKGLK
jgi:hypothetical protein